MDRWTLQQTSVDVFVCNGQFDVSSQFESEPTLFVQSRSENPWNTPKYRDSCTSGVWHLKYELDLMSNNWRKSETGLGAGTVSPFVLLSCVDEHKLLPSFLSQCPSVQVAVISLCGEKWLRPLSCCVSVSRCVFFFFVSKKVGATSVLGPSQKASSRCRRHSRGWGVSPFCSVLC